MEASDWNGLTQTLQELFRPRSPGSPKSSFGFQYSSEALRIVEALNMRDHVTQTLVIVIDIALLDLSTEIWKEQIKFLDRYNRRVKFAWMLNHDTSNAVKVELRRKRHVVMANKPLYKAKMVHILDTVVKEMMTSPNPPRNKSMREGDSDECHEIENIHFEGASSDESETLENANNAEEMRTGLQVDVTDQMCYEKQFEGNRVSYRTGQGLEQLEDLEDKFKDEDEGRQGEDPRTQREDSPVSRCLGEEGNPGSGNSTANRGRSLEGLRILLAEDTPVLQRVATIMLEKLGAKVVAVGDGLQAVNALNCKKSADSNDWNRASGPIGIEKSPAYDLILMDCQVRNFTF